MNKAHAEINSIQRPEWGYITVHMVRSTRERKAKMLRKTGTFHYYHHRLHPQRKKTIQDRQDFSEEHCMLNPEQEGRRVRKTKRKLFGLSVLHFAV